MTDQVRTMIGIVSSLGFVSILIVVIGRLWTTTYFSYFGLSTSDLEFSVDDFAFRSLEAEISLILGAVGFGSAWMSRSWLEDRGLRWAALELALIGLLLILLLVLVADVPGWDVPPSRLLATTGVLGTASGLILMAMLWFLVDIWQGPGTSAGKWPQFLMTEDAWRIVAIVLGSAILFMYLPFISEKLATAEARADLASGKFPIAILQSDNPLPDGIATDADARKSRAVRVILSQSQTTYVLHSTQCTVIGDLEVEKSENEIVAKSSDFCRMFAIPTSRLNFIEYVQVSGSPPSNDTRFLAEEVSLTTPFSVTVSTKGGSGDDDVDCGSDTSVFRRTVWYRFAPSTDGTVLARVKSDDDLEPVVGIWEEPAEGVLEEDAAPGSGPDGFACEYDSNLVGTLQRVGTVANVQKDKRYLIAIGTLNDKGGGLSVVLEFTPQARFLSPDITDALPQISLPSVRGDVQLDVSEINTPGWELQPYLGDLCGFKLVEVREDPLSQEGSLAPPEEPPATLEFVEEDENCPKTPLVQDQEDETATFLEVGPVEPGTWMLQVPDRFRGLVKLTTNALPDLVFAFADPSALTTADAEVQRALFLVIDERSIRDSLGIASVSFDRESADLSVFTLEEDDDEVTNARDLLEEEAAAGELTVQIQVEPQGDQELDLLLEAAERLQTQLLDAGLEATIEACSSVCIRVFLLGSEAIEMPREVAESPPT